MEHDIIALQELVAHQSEDIARLSTELYTQQKEITQLQAQVSLLISQLRAMAQMAATSGDSSPEPPPPHY